MIFNDQFLTSLNDLEHSKNKIIFTGQAIDDRGDSIIKSLKKSNPKIFLEITFNPKNIKFQINNIDVMCRDFDNHLNRSYEITQNDNFTLDATTLSIVELLYIIRWIKKLNNNTKICILYAEPQFYSARVDTTSDFGKHQFNLSDDAHGYVALPGFAKTVSSRNKTHVIALLGFERVRLGQLLSNDEGAYIDRFTPVFGVPGFKPFYDKHSIYQNINLIEKKGEKPHFSGANNPFSTFMLLKRIKESMPEKLIQIAPIGTKPMTIGACLFLIDSGTNVGLMYDHPMKKQGRSGGISKLHSFNITI